MQPVSAVMKLPSVKVYLMEKSCNEHQKLLNASVSGKSSAEGKARDMGCLMKNPLLAVIEALVLRAGQQSHGQQLPCECKGGQSPNIYYSCHFEPSENCTCSLNVPRVTAGKHLSDQGLTLRAVDYDQQIILKFFVPLLAVSSSSTIF